MTSRSGWPAIDLRACAWLFAAFAAAFAVIAWQVASAGALTRVDHAVSAWFEMHDTPSLTPIARVVTFIGSGWVVTPLVVVVGASLAATGRRYGATLLVLSCGGGALLYHGLKAVFQRPRPVFAHPLESLATYSFPSGHAVLAVAFYGVAVVLAAGAADKHRRRRLTFAAAGAAIVVISLSRLYLGAHYLSDVAGGLCAGAAWLLLCVAALEWMRRRA